MKNKPVHTIDEFWPVKVAIFENDGDGGRKHYSAVPTVAFKKDDEWRDGTSFSETNGDAYRLEKALHAAVGWINARKKRNHASASATA